MSISYSRQPCPGRIWDDIGGAFAMGCAGGSILYFFKGKTKYSLTFPSFFF
jgi:mitochondrial import inner membrane translocase subunit TIM17